MNDTVFKHVTYDLNALISNVELGEIGLPDLQRPFVWKNSKIRDLFDSMYRGYPVGYLLLWHSGVDNEQKRKTIGADNKQKVPGLLIVDGQQRLTSLYAVIKGIDVIRHGHARESIKIAFDPIREQFDVTDAAIQRDPSYIQNISSVWAKDTDILEVLNNYLDTLKQAREVSDSDRRKITTSIQKLYSLHHYSFIALELGANVDVEQVAEVFVRINSQGAQLNQADFILTLMSVFWDEGRSELEKFCRDARTPAVGRASPFNHFIKPEPAQLLRVAVGLGFRRARLQYVYSILRGKDLDTGDVNEERRDQQFERLKSSQADALNLTNWHDFLNVILKAGYRTGNLISSDNNLLFAYILFLVGRVNYKVDETDLNRVIAKWFFMSALTGRYTGSPESRMEFDLARLRTINDGGLFITEFERVCDATLTHDFWEITLPLELSTSAARSPALFAFVASQNLLNAPVLFSKSRVSELLDPIVNANKSALERHHLFPKGHLMSLGITDVRDTNQIANYALVEWGDNIRISKKPPSEYVPDMSAPFSRTELSSMYQLHALPDNWENMAYEDFLQERRSRMAAIIRKAYQSLGESVDDEGGTDLDIAALIEQGESDQTEFKSTLRVNLHTGKTDARIEHAVLKTIAGYLNTDGGTLIVGVADDGAVVGIEADKFESDDKMSLHLSNIIKKNLGAQAMVYVHPHFDEYEGEVVLKVDCQSAPWPVYVKDGNAEHFYVRTGPSTTSLSVSQAQQYIGKRFKQAI